MRPICGTLCTAIPSGVMPKVQAVRANVENSIPFYSPRMYNV